MIQVRRSVFETNSSMTHCCVITSENEFSRWADDEMRFCEDKEVFLEKDLAFEENIHILEEKSKSNYCKFTAEDIDKYKNGELTLSDIFSSYIYELRDFYISSAEWDSILEDGNYEYWEKKEKIATNPPTTIVAFGYLGADY